MPTRPKRPPPTLLRRWAAVSLHKFMPKLSLDGIAKKIQCTTSFVKRWVGHYERLNNVEDNTRTGRPPLGKKERSSADQRG